MGRDFYPENGLIYLNYYRTHTPAINVMNENIGLVDNLTIGNIFTYDGDLFVEICNTSNEKIDISYCYLQCGEYYDLTIFPENTVIDPSGTVVMATDNNRAEMLMPDAQICENECHRFQPGDKVAFLDPAFKVIHQLNNASYIDLIGERYNIVINEINYNSRNTQDSGDWVELYNTEDFSVNVSGWIFKDASDDHIYTIPPDTSIEPGGYLVLVQDMMLFEQIYSDIGNCVSDFEFGLRGSGELVRLFTDTEALIDSLTYDDEAPWPEYADGEGSTLSLINPYLDNALPESWLASEGRGTPGRKNDVYSDMVPD